MADVLSANTRVFEKPFAYAVYYFQTENYCSYCLRPASGSGKLSQCTNCRLARYCDRDCQKNAWQDHRLECERLKASFPNLPLTDVLLLARVIDKLNFIQLNSDLHSWQKDRNFDQLMGHDKEIAADEQKMQHFERIYKKTARFVGNQMPPKQEFFLIFCRTWINSHCIHASVGTEIAVALDLGVSRYDHRCRPNATLVFDGFRALIRPLEADVDCNNYQKTFISYVDMARSRYQRRQQLHSHWYFWCECERCQDSKEDLLTALRCSNRECPEPIVITEETVITEPLVCTACQSELEPETAIKAQNLMKNVPLKLPSSARTEQELEQHRLTLDSAEQLLHPDNVYYCRLLTAYLRMSNGADVDRVGIDIQKRTFDNYKKWCGPNHRYVGYQLLHLIKSLIVQKRRPEALPYAYEAMSIFEVCFGFDHPYYLQTLALWTYLESSARKSDSELLQLLNFSYNRTVDLSAFGFNQ